MSKVAHLGPLANERIQAALRSSEKDAELQWAEDMKWILSSAIGRRILLTIALGRHGRLEAPCPDDLTEGRRALVRELLEEAEEADPEAYALAWTERMQSRATEKTRRRAVHTRAATEDANG